MTEIKEQKQRGSVVCEELSLTFIASDEGEPSWFRASAYAKWIRETD